MGLQFNREFKLKTAFGHLAAKIWGPDDGIPIIALHGLMDNAGSFDALAPLLPHNTFLLCLDFCGHGLSSGYPPGACLTLTDHVFHVKLVFDHFKWDKIVIIGHSMGALVGILFTSLFPNKVEKLVSLDIVSHVPFSADQFLPRIARNLNDLQQILLRMEDEPSTHTYQEARDRLIKGYKSSITEKDADILLIRGLVKKDDNKYFFSRDLRTNISTFLPLTAVQIQEMARNICCPFLLIIAKGNTYYHNVKPDSELLDIYRNASADFRYVEVYGKHHVHLSQPDVVLPHIVDFLYPNRNPKSNL